MSHDHVTERYALNGTVVSNLGFELPPPAEGNVYAQAVSRAHIRTDGRRILERPLAKLPAVVG